MKKFLLFCMVTIIALCTCTSCGLSRSATYNANVAQTEVVLAKKNYKVIGTVQGECTQNYWLGIGGMSKKSLGSLAMSEMYRNANLEGTSRAVINVNICYKNSYILIYNQCKAIAQGTVIEFTE